ncbi:class I SAM-dependent methyltransferase [Streptomyces sp. 891-h]|uniref:class I SAM-dependent methyltransferase n=1 Tax=Streptomyces sp. 891-h TaxID=2720714 RepID=UPI001FAA610D|nr:class I SAM-dependent methyltransferase [Streptomyces sp. 891-h]
MAYDRSEWSRHYDEGKGFRPLRDVERGLFARHTPTPDGGRALEVGCGTGELAAHLAELGYHVDGVDFAEGPWRAPARCTRAPRVSAGCVSTSSTTSFR